MADAVQAPNPSKRKPLTVERLRQVLSYDPEIGSWVWAKTLSIRRSAGSAAGDIKPSGYLFIGIDGHRYRAHRLAWLYMTGEWPQGQIDHINGDRSDNRWANLREATQVQNSANMSVRRSNRIGVKGVSLYRGPRGDRYRAHITVAGVSHHLGSFRTVDLAREAYAKAARAFWGEFARA